MDAIVVDDDGSATEDEALSNGSEILVEDTDSEGIDDIGGHLEDTEPVVEVDVYEADTEPAAGMSPELIEMASSGSDTEDESTNQVNTEENIRPANPVPWHSPGPPPTEPRTASSPTASSSRLPGGASEHLLTRAAADNSVSGAATATTNVPTLATSLRSIRNTPGRTSNESARTNPGLPSTSGATYLVEPALHPPQLPSSPVLNSSMEAFKTPKRYQVPSPSKKPAPPTPDKDEGSECPICFEQWSNSGDHRLASLKCGHLFGFSCIDKWLRGQGGKCPQCNAKSTKKDIRVLYAKSLKTIDTTERDQALSSLEKEKEARKRAEMEAAQAKMRCQVAQDEVARLRREAELLRQQLENSRSNPGALPMSQQASQGSALPVTGGPRGYQFDRLVKVWDAGQCRVMCYSPRLGTLIVSQPSASPLFPGFGVKKISSIDFKTCQFVSIHQKMIRDVAFNPANDNGILLSCAMDKTVKMTTLSSNTISLTYQCPQPVWSCTWNQDDHNLFYAGLQNGLVYVYDIRNTNGHLQHLNTNGPPVVSLEYIEQNVSSSFRPGGLAVGQLNKSTFFELTTNGEYKPHALRMDGQLTCLSVEGGTRHLLASYRPTGRTPATRHMVYELRSQGGAGTELTCMANEVHTFNGGGTQKLLTRSKLIRQPGNDKILACAADEATQCINIWDTSSGNCVQKLPAHSTVLDLCDIEINGTHYLAGLTEKVVRLFKWTS